MCEWGVDNPATWAPSVCGWRERKERKRRKKEREKRKKDI
jgi:hypothetical protein